MSSSLPRQASLDALWSFFVGTTAAIGLIITTGASTQTVMLVFLGACGASALLAGLHVDGRRRILFLLMAGLALGGLRGLQENDRRAAVKVLLDSSAPIALRANLTALEGWSASRWGRTSTVRVNSATFHDQKIDLPRRSRIEIRTQASNVDLPRTGSHFEALVSLKGTIERPLLVCSSPKLLTTLSPPRGASALRGYLASSLIRAAATDSKRIQSAELAAGLALGRRDLIPAHRRQGWRESGLGHALAVSGLHVGVVAGTLWLIAVIGGMQPRSIRWFLLVAVPGYTVLAGAAPSAVRACLMVCLYLAARLFGRAAVALGTVLTAASIMLLSDPVLVVQPGFQLTVVVTAALVRWTPALTESLRGPQWLRAAVAIPVVAQIAAAPIVAVHFKTVIPLAAVVNLAIPLLLTPAIPLAVSAVVIAPVWQSAACLLLDMIGLLSDALWFVGGLGRYWAVVVPAFPAAILIVIAIVGLAAFRYDAIGKSACVAWLALMLALPTIWIFSRGADDDRAEVLPVSDGLAMTVTTKGSTLLFDSGRYRSEVTELLADGGISHLATVILSHGDEDHAGGIREVIETIPTDRLIIPDWLMSEPRAVPFIRAARRSGTLITPVARGSLIHSGGTRLDIVWPPAYRHAPNDNDRSLVIRATTRSGPLLLTGDIGSGVERILVRSSYLDADILLVPHHGSASSTSNGLLDAVTPSLALIPAGPMNRHNHPHPTVLKRLSGRGIPFVYPARDGRCGALSINCGAWRAYTMRR